MICLLLQNVTFYSLTVLLLPHETLCMLYLQCACSGNWYGDLCQCHPDLNPGGTACRRDGDDDPIVGLAGGVIAAIVLGIIVLISK